MYACMCVCVCMEYTWKQDKSKGAVSMALIPVRTVCNYKKFKSQVSFED